MNSAKQPHTGTRLSHLPPLREADFGTTQKLQLLQNEVTRLSFCLDLRCPWRDTCSLISEAKEAIPPDD